MKIYLKITNKEEKHNNFQYTDGLNDFAKFFHVKQSKFNALDECHSEYFLEIQNIVKFLNDGIYLRQVFLPENDKKFKMYETNEYCYATRIILDKRRELSDINTFKFLFQNGLDVDKNIRKIFVWACRNGYLLVTQWLHNEYYEKLDFDKWTYHDNEKKIKDCCGYDVSFQKACSNGHLNVAQWFYSLGKINVHYEYDKAFKKACQNGHLNVAQWLYSLNDINIHMFNEAPFRLACCSGYLNVAQWLYNLGGIDIHAGHDEAFIYCNKRNYIESYYDIAKWLSSITSDDHPLKITNFITLDEHSLKITSSEDTNPDSIYLPYSVESHEDTDSASHDDFISSDDISESFSDDESN